MALSRFGMADVYVFECVNDFDGPPQLTCCGCFLAPERGSFWATDTEAMYEHLLAHRDAGHNIPDWLLAEVRDYTLGEE